MDIRPFAENKFGVIATSDKTDEELLQMLVEDIESHIALYLKTWSESLLRDQLEQDLTALKARIDSSITTVTEDIDIPIG